MRPAVIGTVLVLAGAVAACGTDNDSGPERRSAAGEVLGGEISDAMIPLDTVRSTAPVAAPLPAPGDIDGSGMEPRAVRPQAEGRGESEPFPSDPVAEGATAPPED